MLRAAVTSLTAILLAIAAPASALQRAITSTGEIIPHRNAPVRFALHDFNNVAIDPALQQLVDKLGSSEYAQREQATHELREREFDREQMYAVLAQQELNAEQRHRLLSVIIERLANTPRGAVGISMRWEGERLGQPGAIIVEQLIPGFDAAHVLELRDRIILVEGNPLFDTNDFGRLVQSMSPGDEVHLTVERVRRHENGGIVVNEDGSLAYDTLQLSVKLGSLEELKSGPGANRVVQPDGDAINSEIRWALGRFASPRRSIKVKGEMPAPSLTQPAYSSVDAHRDILELRAQIEDFENGMFEDLDVLRQVWNEKLDQLAIAAYQPNISDQEREERMSVMIRFREIISQHIGGHP
jgi:hypothetical protein